MFFSRKMNFQVILTPILIISMLLTPLYQAGVLQAKAAPIVDNAKLAPDAARAASVDTASLPPLSIPNIYPENLFNSLFSSTLSAPAASAAPDAEQFHYASKIVDIQRLGNNWPDRPIYWENPENVLGEYIAGQETWGRFVNESSNAPSDELCIVVALDGKVALDGSAYNNYAGAVEFYARGAYYPFDRLPVSISISDKILDCDDSNWIGLGATTPGGQWADWFGRRGQWGQSVTGIVRSIRLSLYSGGGSLPDNGRNVEIDAIRVFGQLIPDGADGEHCNCNPQNKHEGAQVSLVGPINPRTGNYVYANTDLSVSGRGQPLSFRRIYSAARINYSDDTMGPGWTHNYNQRLIFPDDPEGEFGTVIFQEANGSRQRFDDDGSGTYSPYQGLVADLTRSGSFGSYIYTMVLSDQTRYQFNNAGQLIQIDQGLGSGNGWNPLVLTYDTNNLLWRVTDGVAPNQRYLEFVYDTNGHLTEVHDQRRATDSNSPDVSFAYDSEGNLDGAADLRGQMWTYDYEPITHRLTSVNDPLGHVVEVQDYNTEGRVIEQRDGLGNVTAHFNYSTANNKVIVTDGRGNSRTYTFDGQGAFAGIEFNDGTGVKTTDFNYNYDYNPETQTDANGNVTQLSWNPGGETLSSITDANNNVTSYNFDPTTNNLLGVTDARNKTTQILYGVPNFPNLPKTIIDALGNHTELGYTAEGYLSDVTNANGVVTHYNYNAFGQRTQAIANFKDGVYSPLAPIEDLITSYGYDALGRVTSVTDPQGHVDKTEYDEAGNVTKTIRNFVTPGTYNSSFPDRNIVTTMIYDAAGRLISSTDTLGHVTKFVYDNANHLTRVVRNFAGSDPATVIYNSANPDQNIITEYTYDAVGNQTRVTDTLGRVTASVYNTLNRLVRVVQNFVGADPATVAYNAANPDQNIITEYTYDAAGNQTTTKTTVTDLFSRIDRVCYDALNRPVSRIQNVAGGGDPCSLTTSGTGDQNVLNKMVYDANGNVIDIYDAANIRTHFVYDELNRQVASVRNYQDGTHYFSGAQTDPPDRDVINITHYDTLGNVDYSIGPDWRVTWTCYDVLNRSVKTVVNPYTANPSDPNVSDSTAGFILTGSNNPCNAGYTPSGNADQDIITTTSYDALSRVTDTTDALGRSTHFVYDNVGRVTSQISNYEQGGSALPDKNVTEQTIYDGLGRVLETIDPLGHHTKYFYDALGRQTSTIRNFQDGNFNPVYPDEDVKTISTFDGLSQLLSQTDPNNHTTSFQYDALGRLKDVTDPLTQTAHTAYDAAGNVLSVRDPLNHTTAFTYDGLNRQTQIMTPLTLTTKSSYDNLGRMTAQTDGNGIQDRYTYDALGRLSQVRENFNFGSINDPNSSDKNVVTSYIYSVAGDLLTMNLPGGAQYNYGYDHVNRRLFTDGPIGGTVDVWTTTYDKIGNVLKQYDPNNPIDPNNPSASAPAVQMEYDALNRLKTINYTDSSTADVTYQYDAAGRRTQMTDGIGTTSYVYDNLDRIKQITDPLSQTVGYQYDAGGRRVGLTLPGSRSVQYGYDDANRLTQVTDWDAATSNVAYTYDNANRVTDMTLPNGVHAHYDYDIDNRLTAVTYDKNSQQLMQFQYTLDKVGNRLSVNESLQVIPTGPAAPTLVSPISVSTTPDNTPTFTWNPVSGGPFTYEIQVDDDTSFSTALEFTFTGSGLTKTPTVAIPDGVYNWRVRAISNQGVEGAWSAVWTLTIDTTSPAVPTLLTPADNAPLTIVRPAFTWSSDATAAAYELEIDDNADFLSLVTNSPISTTTPNYSMAFSLQQGTYYWRVRARDTLSNWSAFSPTRTFTINLQDTPANASFTVDTTPLFSWFAATSATAYQIEVDNDADFSSPIFTSGGAFNSTAARWQATSTTLAFGTYYWRVNLQLNEHTPVPSPFSRTFIVSPALPNAPVLAAPATATTIADNTPDFGWSASTSTLGTPYTYEIQVDNSGSTFPSPEFTASGTYDPIKLKWYAIPTIPLADGTYSWRVRTVNNVGAPGAWSTPIWTVTIDTTPPPVPVLTAPADTTQVHVVKPVFTWGASTGATLYQIQVDNNNDFSSPEIDQQPSAASYTSTVSLPQGTYYWHVLAKDASLNTSAFSSAWSFRVNMQDTPADNTISTNAVQPFVWWAVTGITTASNYQIQIATDTAFTTLVVPNGAGVYNSTTTKFTYTPAAGVLTAGTTYYWRVNVNLGSGMVTSPFYWKVVISPALPNAPALAAPATATTIADNTPDFGWSASTSTLGTPYTYEIQVDNSGSTFPSPEFTASGSALSQTPTTPLADGTYSWRVRTINNVGALGAWSTPIWTVTIDTTPPPVPVLSAPADTSQVHVVKPPLTWGASTGATLYQIQVDNNNDFSSPEVDQQPTSASYTPTVSLPQGTYYWHVRAKDAVGNWSAYSGAWTFRVNMQDTPADNTVSTNALQPFVWWAVTGITTAGNYQIQVATDTAFTTLVVPNGAGVYNSTTTKFTYTPTAGVLTAGTIYYWRVNVNLGSGMAISPFYWKVVISPALPNAPALVAPATATTIADNTPDFSWSASTSTAGMPYTYEIQVDNSGSTFPSPEFTASGSALGQTPTTPLADGTYSWRVRTINNVGAPGAWSTPIWTVTIDTTPPAAPTLSAPVDNAPLTAVRPPFSWAASATATLYEVQIGKDPDFAALAISPAQTSTTTSYVPASSLPQGTYSWRVRAKDAVGNWGAFSAVRTFTINIQSAPADNIWTTILKPAFTWVAAATATQYQVEVSTDRNFTSPVTGFPATAISTATSYTPAANMSYGRYYWRVNINYGSGFTISPFYWTLTISPNPPSAPSLMSPGNGEIMALAPVTFAWEPSANAAAASISGQNNIQSAQVQTDGEPVFSNEIHYEFQLDNDADFSSLVFSSIRLDTSFTLGVVLEDDTYYWRVRGINSLDVPGDWSQTYRFVVDSSIVPVPSATPNETETLTPTDTLEPTATSTDADTATASPTDEPTATLTASTTPSETPTAVPTEAGTGGTSVANASDDVNESGDDFDPSNREIWIGTGNLTEASYTGLRFTNLQIPQGAIITSAHVEFYTKRSAWITMDLRMAAEAVDNSLTFSPENRPSGRTLTTQQVEHHSGDKWQAHTWYALDDISSAIQEVVDRDGWQSGNSLSIILRGIGEQWGRKYVTSYEGDPAHAPRLVVTYSEPTATTDNSSAVVPPPVVVQPGPLTGGQYEETQAGIQYSGVWSDYAGSEPSGGSVKYTNDPNATIDFQFEGVGVTLAFTQRADSGQKVVCVDNACQLIDLYSADTQWTQPTSIVGLQPGIHSVQIRNISATYGDLDAVRVFGSEAEVQAAGVIKTATPTPTTEVVVIPTSLPTETATATLIPTAIPATLPFIETFDSGTGWSAGGAWLPDTQTAYAGAGWFADTRARGQVSALVYEGFIDLSGATHPQLSFWQKGQLASSDSVSIEILPEGGTGGVPVDVQSGLMSDWAQHSVDLSAYAGQVIRLRLLLTTGETLPEGEVSTGYSLDELTIQDVVVEATEVPIPTAVPTGIPTATLEPTPVPTDLPTVTPTDMPTSTPSETASPTETPTLPPIDGQTGMGDGFIGGGKGVAAPAMQSGPMSRSIVYSYDGLYRLKSADYKENAALVRAYTYNYDLAGNRTKVSEYVPGVGDYVTNFVYDPQSNRLNTSTKAGEAQRAYTYDFNGNLTGVTAGGETFATYTYDAADRLKSFTDASTGSVSNYTYNGLGDRYQQTVDGVTTNYLLDPTSGLTQVLGEFKPGSDTYYLLGLDVIGQQQGTNWSYFGYDALGSVRQMTDSSGAVGYSANYDPYGNPLEQFGTLQTNLGFTGEYTDPSGLLYLRARYANLSTGTFLSRDPFEGVMQRAMSRNSYSYVEGNPINRLDPSGRFPAAVVAAVCVATGVCEAGAAAVVAVGVVAAVAVGAAAALWWLVNHIPRHEDLQGALEQCKADLQKSLDSVAEALKSDKGLQSHKNPYLPYDIPFFSPVPWDDLPVIGDFPGGESDIPNTDDDSLNVVYTKTFGEGYGNVTSRTLSDGKVINGVEINGHFYPKDTGLPPGSPRNAGGGPFASYEDAMAAARSQVGRTVQVADGKWRNIAGNRQIRAIENVDYGPGVASPHIHIEAIDPDTGQITSNSHYYFNP